MTPITRLLIAALIVLPLPALAEDPPRRLTVTGTGEVAAAPDRADITVGIEAADRTAAAAMAAAGTTMQAVFAALDAEGIAPADRQTSQLSLYPQYADRQSSGGAPVITGYIAASDLTVTVRSLDRVGPVLDVLTGLGANRLGGISFGISEPGPLADRARAAAVADALRKAAGMAEAAGVVLGPVQTIREAGGAAPIPQPMMRAEAMIAAEMPVAGGELTLRESVVLEFALE